MKVGQLVAALNEFEDNMDVLFASENEDVIEKGELVRLFEFDNVAVVPVERMRDIKHKPRIKIGTEKARGVVFITVTTDF